MIYSYNKSQRSWIFSEEISADVWQLSQPERMMDTIDNIERVIAYNTHIITTDYTLYFLDFNNGEAVRQLENVTSFYHFHIGTVSNPLRYVRTADGTTWRVDGAQPLRLPDDYIVRCGRPVGDAICESLLNLWFDNVREASDRWVLTEDNALWLFDRWWEDDAEPSMFAENIHTLHHGVHHSLVITTDNVLWRLPAWDEDDMIKVMENVQSISRSLIITTDNELWGYRYMRDENPFKITENVQSVQPPFFIVSFGFITMDNTLWWMPDWGARLVFQDPIPIKENVLRTWHNCLRSEYILTTDGSLWFFNHDVNYFIQVFQAVPE